jgi:hypothetical protein
LFTDVNPDTAAITVFAEVIAATFVAISALLTEVNAETFATTVLTEVIESKLVLVNADTAAISDAVGTAVPPT